MREKILNKLADWHSSHPWRMLIVMIAVTFVMAGLAGRLNVSMRTQDLLPEGDPKVEAFNQIVDEFSTATSLIVVVQGEEEKIKAFADDIAPRILDLKESSQNELHQENIQELKTKAEKLRKKGGNSKKLNDLETEISRLQKRIDFPLFQRVDYKAETEFLKKHALMLVEADDLKDTGDLFTDPNLTGLISNINNAMEKEYVGQEESISTREKEDNAVNFLDGIGSLVSQLLQAATGEQVNRGDVEATADKFLLGEPYFLSYDKSTLILNAIPNFTILDRDLLFISAEDVQALVDDLLKDYPGVQAGLSGDIAREHDEQIASSESLNFSTMIAFAAILVLLVIAFRMLSAPLMAMTNLLVGLMWAMGAAFLLAGQLNMMTAMLSIVLLGLGIDFSIHLISGFTEWRAAGAGIKEALQQTFMKIGKGIITGALTTACAFLALLISQSRGMKEMGLVTGAGLISMMLATFLFLPSLMVLREKFRIRRQQKKGIVVAKKDISFKKLGKISLAMSQRYLITLAAAAVVSAILIGFAFQIKYDQNWLNMEPEGLTSIALSDTIVHKFDMSMEYSLCLAESVEKSRELVEAFKDHRKVARTSDISVYLPSDEEQQKRIPFLTDINQRMASATVRSTFNAGELPELTQELERLEMNIMEMQDMAFIGGQDKVDEKCKTLVGDPDISEDSTPFRNLLHQVSENGRGVQQGLSKLQRWFAPYYKENVLTMSSTELIQFQDLPESVLDEFCNKDRDLFMISIYPQGSLYEDNKVLNKFVDDMNKISPKTTGGPSIAVAWMRIAARDGRNAIILTLVVVFLLLWFDLKKPWYALMAMTPLALGAFWMVGIMQISGLMLNFMTMMGLPLIIGIGIDDGVHIMHRWREEGRGRITTVFASTGKAILLTSLTTMLAFGSMVFSVFPAWAWFGGSLFIGVGACFLTTVIVLSGIIGWIERNERQNANTLSGDE